MKNMRFLIPLRSIRNDDNTSNRTTGAAASNKFYFGSTAAPFLTDTQNVIPNEAKQSEGTRTNYEL